MTTHLNSQSKESSFLHSALTLENSGMPLNEFPAWFDGVRDSKAFRVERIPFDRLDNWHFEEASGDLAHASGKFFRIDGIEVSGHPGAVGSWQQPIMNQPEIGILGIVTRVVNGVRYFLMQAKMEPGNVNKNQLSPTVQATKSNYTQVHKGKLPLYVEYFIDRSKSRVLVDQLQSEQGARFLRKRNRNMIVEVDDIEVHEGFCWLTLGQLKQLALTDDLINMDARSVISCAPMVDPKFRWECASKPLRFLESFQPFERPLEGFGRDLFVSMADVRHNRSTTDDIISWFTEVKARCNVQTRYIPLKEVKDWTKQADVMEHETKKYFSVVAVSVEAEGREVTRWSQPLVAHCEVGIIGYLAKRINGVMHFLVQAKPEPGVFDFVEMSPTVACCDPHRNQSQPGAVPFLEYFVEANPSQIRYSAIQSEEGGRFYQVRNRYMVVEVGEGDLREVPPDFIWMTLRQIIAFTRHNNYFNVEARGLLACLGLV